MKYLIANRVIYDSETGALVVNEPGAEQSKKLTNTANRILSLLIESPGRVLERDYLLDKVWEEVGHAGSSSSLSQYISILRKTLTTLIVLDEIIIAVPKVGFYFSAEIPVEIQEDRVEVSTVSHQNAQFEPIVKDKASLWLGAILFFLVLANIWLFIQNKDEPRFAQAYRVGMLGNCHLTVYDDLSDELDPKILSIIRERQPDIEKRCNQMPAQVMVHFQRSVLYGSHGRFFYAYCPMTKVTKKITYCENYYAFNWKQK